MRFGPLAACVLFVGCSASHDASVDAAMRLACGAGGPCDGDTHAFPDTGPRPDVWIDPGDASPYEDTDPYPGDAFSPGACTWSLGPVRPITHGIPGGKLLGTLSLGASEVVFAWGSASTNDVFVEGLHFDGSVAIDARTMIPTPASPGFGSVVATPTLRAALVGPTRGCILVPLSAADVRLDPLVPASTGRCLEAEATGARSVSFVALPLDGSAGARYQEIDATSGTSIVDVSIAPTAIEAHRTVRHGALEGHFLFVSADAAGAVTAQHFDSHAVPAADPVRLPPGAGTLRGVGALATDDGWLLALQVGEAGAYRIATLTLDLDGHPTREPYVLPSVRSARGFYYGLARSGGDAVIAWTDWHALGTQLVAMHAQPLSLDGFPRGAVLDVGEFTAAGSAPDAIEALGTPEGVVLVFHAQRDPAPAEPELYAALLGCH